MSTELQWLWKFEPDGSLAFASATSPDELEKARLNGFASITAARLKQRVEMLLDVYGSNNASSMYAARQIQHEMGTEPAFLQVLAQGAARPEELSPHLVYDLATVFCLPPSFFLISRLQTVPRPFLGTKQRWDRMSLLQPCPRSEPVAVAKAPKKSAATKVGTPWQRAEPTPLPDKYADGTSPFVYAVPPARLYVIDIVQSDLRQSVVLVAATMADARELAADHFPHAEILQIHGTPATPGVMVHVDGPVRMSTLEET